jgi:hypothetical protein
MSECEHQKWKSTGSVCIEQEFPETEQDCVVSAIILSHTNLKRQGYRVRNPYSTSSFWEDHLV